jgi:hypothetical protein
VEAIHRVNLQIKSPVKTINLQDFFLIKNKQ